MNYSKNFPFPVFYIFIDMIPLNFAATCILDRSVYLVSLKWGFIFVGGGGGIQDIVLGLDWRIIS